MESWILFLILVADALLIMSVLNFRFEAELPLTLSQVLKKLGHNASRFSEGSFGALKEFLETGSKRPNGGEGQLLKGARTGDSILESLNPIQPAGGPTQKVCVPKLNQQFFPRAPVSKGYSCATHRGSVVGCAAFFEHENYEYKLLSRGEIYFRAKGTVAFRTGPVVPKDPGSLFIVKLDDTGSNVVAFCFEPTSRVLGEVNGRAEFLPVQTSIASSQEAHGLAYTQGQGCVFDWIYGNRASPQYPWDYNLRYDVGWMHSIPATEELFASNDELLSECGSTFTSSRNPLKHSLEGLDSVRSFLSPDILGETQDGCVHNLFNVTETQPNDDAQILFSPALSTLPVPLTPSHPSEVSASTSTDSLPTNKSVLRRTCNICNRVLRRPSALAIHMNAHYGIKPFKCNECGYSSTNITNLQRHQQGRHPGSPSGGN